MLKVRVLDPEKRQQPGAPRIPGREVAGPRMRPSRPEARGEQTRSIAKGSDAGRQVGRGRGEKGAGVGCHGWHLHPWLPRAGPRENLHRGNAVQGCGDLGCAEAHGPATFQLERSPRRYNMQIGRDRAPLARDTPPCRTVMTRHLMEPDPMGLFDHLLFGDFRGRPGLLVAGVLVSVLMTRGLGAAR